MEQKNTRENTEMGGVISAAESFIEKNKKLLTIAIIVIAVLALAIFGIVKWNASRDAKANAAMFGAEQYFANGEYELALNGNTQFAGLLDVADQYGSTKSGNRAKYQAALCYMYTGKYSEAIDMLNSYKGKDKVTPIMKEITLGSAELEQGNNAAASKHFEKAIKAAKGYEDLASYAIYLNGMAYLLDGNMEKANAQFNELKNYPRTNEYRLADQMIGLTEK